ncbi:MAG: chemotaxis protein CheA [Immundisolibacter sp.]|uniref:chemotaxis protein CheA n=1 Tax=Immundisolibacter sp. TaxID=1934948 RepID=UPI003D0C9688
MDEQDEIISEFLVESQENLDRLDQDLVALESEPGSRERLASIFRTIHTLKGTAGFLAFGTLERLAHTGESLLSRLRDGELHYTAPRATVLLEMVDAIRQMLGNIEATASEGAVDCDALIKRLATLTEDDAPAAAVEPAAHSELVAQADEGDVVAAKQTQLAIAEPPPAQVLAPVTAEAPPAEAAVAVVKPAEESQLARVTPLPKTASVPADDAGGEARGSIADASVRVDVRLLDRLMNLVGELVLARNQILQHPVLREDASTHGASQRLDLITSELQEGVMKTRMQPVGSAWAKFPRVVRDLAVTCGKQVRLETDGADTELDRTILEAIKDPLTHLVRNSVDHGIETRERRLEAGKGPTGTLTLRAYHEGGKVVLEINDDGGGIHTAKVKARALERGLITPERAAAMSEHDLQNLIFLPGFSTADAVSNVSGRGVGMDVVKTNIERIGGSIDLQSRLGQGTSIKIRIPLTLAIVPALIVTSEGERYAIPQVNVLELVGLDAAQAERDVEHIHNVPVYRLRGNVLPLVYLHQVLGQASVVTPAPATIVVVQADDRQFGLVVGSVHDTQEIVVKPLGPELKAIPAYAGATIMGDGHVALIVDVPGIAQLAGLMSEARMMRQAAAQGRGADEGASNKQILLQFEARGGACFAVPLHTVARLEEIDPQRIESTAGQQVVQYRGGMLPLVRLDESHNGSAAVSVIVCGEGEQHVGFVIERVLDIVEQTVELERECKGGELLGTAVIAGRVTDLLDMAAVGRGAGIQAFDRRKRVRLQEVA